MADYRQNQNSAYTSILNAGTLATVSRVSSSYDEVEGVPVVSAVQTDPVAVVNLPASESLAQQFENKIIEDYKKGKTRFFYAAAKGLTLEPESGDLLFFKSKVWELVGSTGLEPDGTTPIIYIFAVKVSNLSEIPVAGPPVTNKTAFNITNPETEFLSVLGLTASDVVTVDSQEDAVLGAELVGGPDMSDTADWTVAGTAIQTATPNGIEVITVGTAGIYQTLATEIDETYLVSVKVYSTNVDVSVRVPSDGGDLTLAIPAGSSGEFFGTFVASEVSPLLYLRSGGAGGCTWSICSTKQLLSDTAFTTAATGTINFTPGVAYGWLYINGEQVYNISALAIGDTVMPSHSINWPSVDVSHMEIVEIEVGV